MLVAAPASRNTSPLSPQASTHPAAVIAARRRRVLVEQQARGIIEVNVDEVTLNSGWKGDEHPQHQAWQGECHHKPRPTQLMCRHRCTKQGKRSTRVVRVSPQQLLIHSFTRSRLYTTTEQALLRRVDASGSTALTLGESSATRFVLLGVPLMLELLCVGVFYDTRMESELLQQRDARRLLFTITLRNTTEHEPRKPKRTRKPLSQRHAYA